MKLKIEIPDDELIEEVKDAIELHIVQELAKQWASPDSRTMRDAYKAAVKEIVKEREDVLIEHMVKSGSELLARNGMKKMLENLKKGIE